MTSITHIPSLSILCLEALPLPLYADVQNEELLLQQAPLHIQPRMMRSDRLYYSLGSTSCRECQRVAFLFSSIASFRAAHGFAPGSHYS